MTKKPEPEPQTVVVEFRLVRNVLAARIAAAMIGREIPLDKAMAGLFLDGLTPDMREEALVAADAAAAYFHECLQTATSDDERANVTTSVSRRVDPEYDA